MLCRSRVGEVGCCCHEVAWVVLVTGDDGKVEIRQVGGVVCCDYDCGIVT